MKTEAEVRERVNQIEEDIAVLVRYSSGSISAILSCLPSVMFLEKEIKDLKWVLGEEYVEDAEAIAKRALELIKK